MEVTIQRRALLEARALEIELIEIIGREITTKDVADFGRVLKRKVRGKA